jgi:outer membrane protein
MKMKKIHAAACAAITCLSSAAFGQSAGDNVVSFGWLHVAPIDSSTPLTTYVTPQPIDTPLRLPPSFTSQGTGLSTNNADTPGLIFNHYLTDHIAIATIAGVPPTFKNSAHGKIVPPGPSSAFGTVNLDDPANEPVVQSVRQWSLAQILQYYFGSPTAHFRPYVGIGVSYNFFRSIGLNPTFVTSVQNSLGSVLAAGAAKPGQTSVSAEASPSWAPMFNAGVQYNITDHWGVTASLTFIPLKTTSTVIIKAADGTVLGATKGVLTADPLISYLGVSYKF